MENNGTTTKYGNKKYYSPSSRDHSGIYDGLARLVVDGCCVFQKRYVQFDNRKL
jgi:hypothetical protein